MAVHRCSDWGCWDRRMSNHEKGPRGGWAGGGGGEEGSPGCKLRSEVNERKHKTDYSSHQATVYELDRYLLSSVPNQVLNSPSSQLNDACNRTRLQHGADRTTEKPQGHLDICSAARLTFAKGACVVLSSFSQTHYYDRAEWARARAERTLPLTVTV